MKYRTITASMFLTTETHFVFADSDGAELCRVPRSEVAGAPMLIKANE